MADYELHLGDCLEYMRGMEAGSVDAVVTDPPYGMNLDTDYSGMNGWSGKGHKYNPIVGDNKPFDPRPFLKFGKLHIFFGAQYYCDLLPLNGGWIVFNKRGRGLPSQIAFGDCELAWCDKGQAVRMYSQMWHGVSRWSLEGRLHPTQKPIGLMRWCIEMVSSPGDLILDPFMGSGTTGVAALQLGRRFIGCEIDPGYFEIAKKRIEEAAKQPPLFVETEPKPQPTQADLWDK